MCTRCGRRGAAMFKYGAALAKGMGDNRLVLHGMWIVGMEIGLFVFGGDIVRAYLSDYAIEEAPSGGAATTMAISNIGPLQSADTVVIIAMNGTAAVLESRCPEGRAEAVGAHVVAVSFDHMTPGVTCEIDVAPDVAPPRLTQFTARGMPEVEVVEGWGRTYGGLNLAVFAMIAGQAVIAAFLVRAKLPALRDMYWPSRDPRYRKSRHADAIAEYVQREYRVRIGHQRASIIESLAGGAGGGSTVRIAAALSLPPPRVRALLRGMRDDGLVDDGGGLDPALRECVEMLGGAGRAG